MDKTHFCLQLQHLFSEGLILLQESGILVCCLSQPCLQCLHILLEQEKQHKHTGPEKEFTLQPQVYKVVLKGIHGRC